ncbi:hypothetical protein [Parafrankia sp. EUN1f]|uniref:hypothetical protein n=1 Tax=Parafrankia sp. EUN1f TaxID=102897 RepID=UPI0001C44AA4|nr:hypothetical protein [Parafrankia sp. EUN1f]EFC84046.1 hypothetical protein FrEUN1fDRAFT_2772 [Parafrankia sp. EUN1f]
MTARRRKNELQRRCARPVDETGARIRATWSELTAADTTTVEAAELLGVTLPNSSDGGSHLR